jgi:ectoine hydroxylase-related dioxygenase (phytanoyl-CoA dioxygenase family)
MSIAEHPLAAPTDVGTLGVYQLKRLWSHTVAARQRQQIDREDEVNLDHLVLDGLGLGLEQTMQYLFREAPTFDAFERWIVATTGGVAAARVARINAVIGGTEYPDETRRWLESVEAHAPVLDQDALAFWDEHGYVVLPDAVSPEGCAAAEQAIWDHLEMRADDPESWYAHRNNGIMVQYFQHPAFDANRWAPRIHKAFAQLWGTADLWVTTDRVGFNVPEREGWRFPGPDLHWDVSLQLPIPFGVQGILYLTDTPPEQGAFTCVPGFQRRIAAWLEGLPPDADPRRQDLHALGSQPIGGRAGDLAIWHHALPHGSRPNRGTRPRIVQYITMYPARIEQQDGWR